MFTPITMFLQRSSKPTISQVNLLADKITILEFNPTISYIPGKASSVGDELSRNVALVSTVADNPGMPAMDEIKIHQDSDAFCSSVKYYQKSGGETNLSKLQVSADTFFMQDSILYNSSEISTENSSERLSQLVIPQSLVSTLLYYVHDSPHA